MFEAKHCINNQMGNTHSDEPLVCVERTINGNRTVAIQMFQNFHFI
jgi:hypothetical protein